MLFQRDCPKGIDFGIHEFQRDLFVELTKRGWINYDSYDRVYKNKRGDEKIPEAYVGKGDYEEVLFNDKKTVTSFFIVDDKRTFDHDNKELIYQDVSIVFQGNVKKMYPRIEHRADEEMINEIRLAINKKFWDNRLTEIITGIEKVYDSLKVSYNKKDYNDMSDFCIVRFNFKMTYSNTEKIIFLK